MLDPHRIRLHSMRSIHPHHKFVGCQRISLSAKTAPGTYSMESETPSASAAATRPWRRVTDSTIATAPPGANAGWQQALLEL